jgi:hypothetical protein
VPHISEAGSAFSENRPQVEASLNQLGERCGILDINPWLDGPSKKVDPSGKLTPDGREFLKRLGPLEHEMKLVKIIEARSNHEFEVEAVKDKQGGSDSSRRKIRRLRNLERSTRAARYVMVTQRDYEECILSFESIVELKACPEVTLPNEASDEGDAKTADEFDELATEYLHLMWKEDEAFECWKKRASDETNRQMVKEKFFAKFFDDWEWWLREINKKVQNKHDESGQSFMTALDLDREAAKMKQEAKDEEKRRRDHEADGQEKKKRQKEEEEQFKKSIQQKARDTFRQKQEALQEKKMRDKQQQKDAKSSKSNQDQKDFWRMYFRHQAVHTNKDLEKTKSSVDEFKVEQSEGNWSRLKWGHLFKQREKVFWKEKVKQRALFTDAMCDSMYDQTLKLGQGTVTKAGVEAIMWIGFKLNSVCRQDPSERELSHNKNCGRTMNESIPILGPLIWPNTLFYAVRLRIFDRFAKDPPTDPDKYIKIKRKNRRSPKEEDKFQRMKDKTKKEWKKLDEQNDQTEADKKDLKELWDFVKKLQNVGGNGQKGYDWPKTKPPPLKVRVKLLGLQPGTGEDPADRAQNGEGGEELDRLNFGGVVTHFEEAVAAHMKHGDQKVEVGGKDVSVVSYSSVNNGLEVVFEIKGLNQKKRIMAGRRVDAMNDVAKEDKREEKKKKKKPQAQLPETAFMKSFKEAVEKESYILPQELQCDGAKASNTWVLDEAGDQPMVWQACTDPVADHLPQWNQLLRLPAPMLRSELLKKMRYSIQLLQVEAQGANDSVKAPLKFCGCGTPNRSGGRLVIKKVLKVLGQCGGEFGTLLTDATADEKKDKTNYTWSDDLDAEWKDEKKMETCLLKKGKSKARLDVCPNDNEHDGDPVKCMVTDKPGNEIDDNTYEDLRKAFDNGTPTEQMKFPEHEFTLFHPMQEPTEIADYSDQPTGDVVVGNLVLIPCGLDELQSWISHCGSMSGPKLHFGRMDEGVKKACMDLYTTALYLHERGALRNFMQRGERGTDVDGTEYSWDNRKPSQTCVYLPEFMRQSEKGNASEKEARARVIRELGGEERGIELFQPHQDGRSSKNTSQMPSQYTPLASSSDDRDVIERYAGMVGEEEIYKLSAPWRRWREYFLKQSLGLRVNCDEHPDLKVRGDYALLTALWSACALSLAVASCR